VEHPILDAESRMQLYFGFGTAPAR
jgi:hypothetical protein